MSERRKIDRKTLILLLFAVIALFVLPRPPSTSSTTATTAPAQTSVPTIDTTTPGYQAAYKSLQEAVQTANGVEKNYGPGGVYYSWPARPKISTSCQTVYSGNSEKDRASWSTFCR